MTLTQELKGIAKQFDIDLDELKQAYSDQSGDFEVDNYRFIDADCIDEVQRDELEGDTYMLGCFTDWFIADNTNLSIDVVQALQEAEKYDIIGQHILDNNNIHEIQEAYASTDGYGHHFSGYDGSEEEVTIDGSNWYVFRIN